MRQYAHLVCRKDSIIPKLLFNRILIRLKCYFDKLKFIFLSKLKLRIFTQHRQNLREDKTD